MPVLLAPEMQDAMEQVCELKRQAVESALGEVFIVLQGTSQETLAYLAGY
jgi:hypothetical protein